MVVSGKDKPNGSEVFLALFTRNNRAIFHFILTLVPNWNDARTQFLTLVATDSQSGRKGLVDTFADWRTFGEPRLVLQLNEITSKDWKPETLKGCVDEETTMALGALIGVSRGSGLSRPELDTDRGAFGDPLDQGCLASAGLS